LRNTTRIGRILHASHAQETAMTDTIHPIPLDQIDAHALPRDRLDLDDTALAELTHSIAQTGLRQPIEVFERAGGTYGLLSGYRRLTAHARLDRATIPAFIRQPRDIPDALAQMIAENEIRAEISPWEKGRIVTRAIDQGLFDTLDEALPALYPALDRHRRARLRAIAEVVEYFGDTLLSEPTRFSQTQLTRLAAALRAGLGEVIETALGQHSDRSPAAQWRLILPILEEHEHDARHGAPRYKKGRPRYYVRPQKSLVVRRERYKDGWLLRFTGRDATGPLMEDILDYVEDLLGTR
jgi:ParB family chromosome partitioning protein